jgi:hypothetical protein
MIFAVTSLGRLIGLLCLACTSEVAPIRSAPPIDPERALQGQQLTASSSLDLLNSVERPPTSSAAQFNASAETSVHIAPLASASRSAHSTDSEETNDLQVLNQGGLEGLLDSLDDVVAVELVDFGSQTRRQLLSDADRKRLLDIVGRCVLIDAHSVAHPPWSAAFLFHTHNSGAYALKLVGSENLRLDPGNEQHRFVGNAAQWNDIPAPEMVSQDGADWIWNYLESRLGKTRSKEYTVPDVSLELRRQLITPQQ